MNDTAKVDAFIRTLEHTRKAERQAMRAINLNASGWLAERIKWKVPSCHSRADLAAFNRRAGDRLRLVMLFPNGLVADPTGTLEGDYDRRRLVYFDTMADVRAKAAALEGVVRAWVTLEEGGR